MPPCSAKPARPPLPPSRHWAAAGAIGEGPTRFLFLSTLAEPSQSAGRRRGVWPGGLGGPCPVPTPSQRAGAVRGGRLSATVGPPQPPQGKQRETGTAPSHQPDGEPPLPCRRGPRPWREKTWMRKASRCLALVRFTAQQELRPPIAHRARVTTPPQATPPPRNSWPPQAQIHPQRPPPPPPRPHSTPAPPPAASPSTSPPYP